MGDDAESVDLLTRKIDALQAQVARLQAENSHFQQLYEKAALCYQSLDENGCYIDVNQKWLDTLGYTRAEVIGKSFGDFIHPDWRHHFRENFPKFKSVGEVLGAEFQLVKKDGSTVLVSLHGKIGTNHAGHFLQTHCVIHDIGTEKELRRLRSYLASLIDAMPSVLIGVDGDGRVTQWNRQAELATGLSLEKARSLPLGAVFPRLSNQVASIKTAVRDGRVVKNAKVAYGDAGEKRYEDITVFPLLSTDAEEAVIRLDDVTQQVRLEEMIIRSEKMLSVGGLAAGMAHEINNPLAGILQNTAVLNNRLCGDLPANRKAAEAAGTSLDAIHEYLQLRKLPPMLENISSSGKRAADIVNNMLGFARKSDRAVSSNDLCKLMDQTVELIKTGYNSKKSYDFKHIRIRKEFDDFDTMVPCEAGKIQQVFLNILGNGAEAMAGVSAPEAKPAFILRVKDDGAWVRVEIEDNGPGMDAKVRERIFEPFFTTKPVGEGTGLGLSVSYFIITEDHGGEMRVQDSDGGGTRFVIRLLKGGKGAGD